MGLLKKFKIALVVALCYCCLSGTEGAELAIGSHRGMQYMPGIPRPGFSKEDKMKMVRWLPLFSLLPEKGKKEVRRACARIVESREDGIDEIKRSVQLFFANQIGQLRRREPAKILQEHSADQKNWLGIPRGKDGSEARVDDMQEVYLIEVEEIADRYGIEEVAIRVGNWIVVGFRVKGSRKDKAWVNWSMGLRAKCREILLD